MTISKHKVGGAPPASIKRRKGIFISWVSVIGFVIMMSAAGLIWETFNADYVSAFSTAGQDSMFYPRILLVLMLILAVSVTIQGLREKVSRLNRASVFLTLGSVALVSGYIWVVSVLGFLLSSIPFLFVFALAWGYKNLKFLFVISVVFPLMVWYLFQKVFLIVLPSSPWNLPF